MVRSEPGRIPGSGLACPLSLRVVLVLGPEESLLEGLEHGASARRQPRGAVLCPTSREIEEPDSCILCGRAHTLSFPTPNWAPSCAEIRALEWAGVFALREPHSDSAWTPLCDPPRKSPAYSMGA